jgi:hypothetical protein
MKGARGGALRSRTARRRHGTDRGRVAGGAAISAGADHAARAWDVTARPNGPGCSRAQALTPPDPQGALTTGTSAGILSINLHALWPSRILQGRSPGKLTLATIPGNREFPIHLFDHTTPSHTPRPIDPHSQSHTPSRVVTLHTTPGRATHQHDHTAPPPQSRSHVFI